jgi:hypothetical protein
MAKKKYRVLKAVKVDGKEHQADATLSLETATGDRLQEKGFVEPLDAEPKKTEDGL